MKILDPFGGTGSVFLETQKYKSAECLCRDYEPMSHFLLMDNLKFFGLKSNELEEIRDGLAKLSERIKTPGIQELSHNTEVTALYNRYTIASRLAIKTIEAGHGEFSLRNSSGSNDTELEAWLNGCEFLDRLLLYLSVRAQTRKAVAIKRKVMTFETSFLKQTEELSNQIEKLIELYKADETSQQAIRVYRNVNISFSAGRYSARSIITPDRFRQIYSIYFAPKKTIPNDSRHTPHEPRGMEIQDACESLSRDQESYDVIISDPPYGINTEHDEEKLSRIWSQSIRSMLTALKPNGGQLVLCLPERTYIGKNLEFFIGKDFVIRQILAVADSLKLDVITPASVVPEPVTLFQPPYYWESARALRRSIVHFRFRARR